MKMADQALMARMDAEFEARKQAVLQAKDALEVPGTRYYVSSDGDDTADGLSPDSSWRTLKRVSDAELCRGDAVLFRRGDVFRGSVRTCAGVTYAAYGSGEKPRFYGWDKSLADPALWELWDAAHHIWRLKEPILDCGTLVFDGGEAHCRKLIPSYIDGRFVCRDEESRPFVIADEMTRDLDLVTLYDARLTTQPSKGQDFPIPLLDEESLGELYLRCDAGNPAEVYAEIEAVPKRKMFMIGHNDHVTIDNVCIRYVGEHAICGGGHVVGLHVSNCEIGWIGGSIQHYFGTDPNYPEGGRGTVTRFGNGVEIYGGCEDYAVENCWLYQIYDAGVTHQVTTNGRFFRMENIRYLNNIIERCVYGVEYFLEKTDGDTQSYIADCEMRGNFIRLGGYGWGQQRHNTDTPALIKGWSYENTAHDVRICGNIFDRCAYRMLHLVAREPECVPALHGNTYIQHVGGRIGSYGANCVEEPENLVFDAQAEEKIRGILGDAEACVYGL